MKQIFLLLIFLSLICKASFAYSPMESRPLKERVELANYVFVGVIEKVIAIDDQNHEINDDRLPPVSNFSLLQVHVEESLSTPSWHPTRPLIAAVSGAWGSVREMRTRLIGQRAIYLTNMEQLPEWGPIFVASYGYFLSEPMEKKAEIQKWVKTNAAGGELWNHFEQLAQCLRMARTIKIGMTRAEIEKLLYRVEQSEAKRERYVFRKLPYISLDIEFDRRTTTQVDDLDTVTNVSKPYLEWIATP